MRDLERDVLIELLAWAAGAVDAWSYFGVGHVFTANMTGNTVLLGVALTGAGQERIAGPLTAILCYAAGVVAAALLGGDKAADAVWPRRISRVLAFEAILLAGTCWFWTVSFLAPGGRMQHVMIGLAAAALGMQSGAMQRLGIPGIVTTYITGTWTRLMDNITRLTLKRPPARKPGARQQWEERMLMQAGVFVLYCLGAAVTGWILRFAPQAAPVVPAGAVFLVAAYGLTRGERMHPAG